MWQSIKILSIFNTLTFKQKKAPKNLRAICKSRNGESGNRIKSEWRIGEQNKENDGNTGNEGGNAGNQGENAGNQSWKAGNQGGNDKNQGRNDGNQGGVRGIN